MTPVAAAPDQKAFLHDADSNVARNKKIVHDFYREVVEAGHLDRAEKYLHENYIQHNPGIKDGRNSFVELLKPYIPRTEIQPLIRKEVVALTGDGDLVTLAVVHHGKDPEGKPYTSTFFDMFRLKDGIIVEHWDCFFFGVTF
jgi:predicted SnoaL-like aldol condensation-catalyzing enzyme